MLIDTLSHGGGYPFGSAWAALFRHVQNLAARGAALPEGSYPLAAGPDAEGATATVSIYTTKEHGRYESHHAMADIQILLEGEEEIGVTPVDGLHPAEPYDAGRDIVFYRETPTPSARLRLTPGLFALLLPQDAHMPGLATAAPAHVKKLVVKLPAAMLAVNPEHS